MKKMISLLLAVLVLLSCSAAAAEAQYTVGICQLVQHEALDQATQGFIDALNAELGEGVVEFDLQVAAGDSSTCSNIVYDFVSNEVDLIMANATPALQVARSATDTIPILGTSITEYGVALDIEEFDGLVGGNISGTSDLAPLDQQAEMITTLFPDTKTVGLLYCSAEANSLYQVETVKGYLEAMGITATLYAFADSNEMAAVVQVACDNNDVIYTPTDNTVAANAGIVDNICRPAGRPVITGDTGTCGVAGVAVLGISYYDLGVSTGKMAAQVLTGAVDISTLPISYAENVTPQYNAEICAELGVQIPENYVPLN